MRRKAFAPQLKLMSSRRIDLKPLMMSMVLYFSYNQEPQKLAAEMKQIFQTGSNEHPLVSFIKQGMADKSIRSDIDPDITALTIDQTLLSMGQRIAARKEEMRYEYGIEKPDKMIEILITTILRGIKRRA